MPSQAEPKLSVEFPPSSLREYALLADGERGILVGPRGDFAWMCAPSWHSEAVFSTLVGGRGLYAVSPADPRFVWGGYYEERSLIWRSRWVTTTGIIESREALAFPGDPRLAVVLRRIIAVTSTARVRVVLDPRAGFGRHPMRALSRDGGIWTARTGALQLRWSGAEAARRTRGGALVASLELEAGSHHDLVLEISQGRLGEPPLEGPEAWRSTEAAWASAVPEVKDALSPRDTGQAYAVLQGLTSHCGGMVAAATTSLPERAEEGRNYDYRYAWIRDQSYVGQALAAAGPHPLIANAVQFVSERLLADGPQLKPAYTVEGGPVPEERALSHLAGYPGGSDRTGNRVNHQFQLDGFGEALLLFAAAARHGQLESSHWRAVEIAVSAIESRWTEADAGIWELGDQLWTHSRLSCVAGLRALARARAAPALAAAWSGLADAIMAEVASSSTHPSGRWQRSPSDERVDAALLLPVIRGGLPATDSRSRATLEAVKSELVREGYAYRFRHDERELEEAEGSFLLCGFLMALASHQLGDEREAISWFERSRTSCGSAGLFTEEFDVRQRQQRGNTPQAFVHALMLECSYRLLRPWDGP